MTALRLAVAELTSLPLRVGDASAATRRLSRLWYPVVGAALGLATTFVVAAVRVLFFSREYLVPATIGVAVLAALAGGRHLIGLAAIVDAEDSGRGGTIALVVVLLLQIAGLALCLDLERGSLGIVLAATVGRTALACHGPARLGRGAAVALSAVVVAGAALAGYVDTHATLAGDFIRFGWTGVSGAVLAVVLGLVAGMLTARLAVRRVGTLGDDALGAVVEVATTVTLLLVAATAAHCDAPAIAWLPDLLCG